MDAVVVLTRGYNDKKMYKLLIERNKCLEKFIHNNIDYIIFHEGNIYINDQNYIQTQTPKLKLKFIDVEQDFKKDNIDCASGVPNFSMGYRNMCNFWFVGFWKYTNEYNKLLRIDEDCLYYNDHAKVFDLLDNYVAVYGKTTKDREFVTMGLNKFTLDFLKKNKSEFVNKISKEPSGPYTNVIGLNINELRKNELLNNYINAILLSNNIYIYRWGDLPLWGEVLFYMYNKSKYLETTEIKYYHESHDTFVN